LRRRFALHCQLSELSRQLTHLIRRYLDFGLAAVA
jgi:hypothetical protein